MSNLHVTRCRNGIATAMRGNTTVTATYFARTSIPPARQSALPMATAQSISVIRVAVFLRRRPSAVGRQEFRR
jgi:hypothetical protein